MACVCLFVNLSFSSSIVPYKNLEHLSQSSQIIVVVKALPEQIQVVNGYTEYYRNFEVLDILKGQPKSEIQIKSGKRTIGDYTNIIHGEFDFHTKDTYLLFLDEMSDGSYYPVCLSYYVFQEVSKHGEAFFVPRYEDGALQLIDKKKERILHVYQKDAFVNGLKQYVNHDKKIDISEMIADEETQGLTESIKKASPAHCSFLTSNNGLRYQVKDLDSQALSIYYQNGQSECAAVNAEMQSAIDHMNDNYSGIQLRNAGTASGYTPDCSGNRAYNISFFGGSYDIYMEQQLGTSRAVLVQFGDPCNEIPNLNNCSGTVAFGGSWAIGIHDSNGESFNTAVYGYVVVNDGMGSCNCGDFSGNSPITDFSAIMVHEISHTVGLNHIGSNFGQANMNPISGTQISNLDRQCMDDLYPPSGVVNPPAEPGTPDLRISTCGSVSQSANVVNVSNIQIQNSGNETTGRSSRVGIYMSTDNTITTADRMVTSVAIPQLAAGSSTTVNASFDISGIPDGNYTVGMIVDDNGQIAESNENNNSCFDNSPRINIDTTPAPTRDLVINNCGNVSVTGNNVSVNNLIIRNAGNAITAAGAVVSYYISTDNTITNLDVLAGSKNIVSLAAGSTTTINHSFNVSSLNLEDGTYKVGMIIDANNAITEINENNNTCIDNSPSLIIDTATAPTRDLVINNCGNVSVTGNNVSVNNLIIRNAGNATTSAGAVVSYYISTDNTITNSDVLAGSKNIVSLAAGSTTTINHSFDVSSLNLADGTYKVGMIIDANNAIQEMNENNNTCFDNSPSLVIDTAPAPTRDLVINNCGNVSISGNTVSVNNLRIRNAGNTTTAAGAIVSYYVSADNTITASDKLAGSKNIAALSAGSMTTINHSFNVSSLNLADGTYKVGMIIDANNTIQEINENNNTCIDNSPSIVIDTAPPAVADLNVPGCINVSRNGDNINVNDLTVRNSGNASSGTGVEVGYYLSADNVIRTSDILIGSHVLPSLVSGASNIVNKTLNISSLNIANGSYVVGVIVDYKNVLEESNEGNNSCFDNTPSIIIESEPAGQPDLMMNTCGSLTVNAATARLSNVRIENIGSVATSAGVVAGIYISSDQNITSADKLVGSTAIPILAPNAQTVLNQNISIPTLNLDPGIYTVGVIIDIHNVAAESNENNNSCFVNNPKIIIEEEDETEPNTVGSDLDITRCGTAQINGNTLRINNTIVRNVGDEQTSGFSYLGYYLSTNQAINTNDIYLGYDYVTSLDPNTQSPESASFNLSNFDLEDGEYYIGMIADFGDRVEESDETNNACRIANPKVIIGGGDEEPNSVDLQVSCGSISQSSNAVSVDGVELYNAGDKNTDGGVFFAYYLSTDDNITTDDYLLELGQDYVQSIRAGQRINRSGHFTLNGIPDGDYYFGVLIDHRFEVDESNENNNSCHISNTKVTVGLLQDGEADLIATCNQSNIRGNEINVTEVNITNIGSQATSGYSFVGYYLSADKEITSADHYVGYDYLGILSANQSSRQQEKFQVSDLTLSDGEYYLGVIADFTSRSGETNTTNNTCVFEDSKLIIGASDIEEGGCELYNENGFEDGRTGIWVDGGAHAFVNAGATFATTGLRAMAIRGNEGKESSIYTSAWIKNENFTELTISFNYYAYLMESGDAFVLDVDTGSGFTEYKRWNADIDFTSAKNESEGLTIPMNSDIKLRFRSVTSHTYEYVFLDDIVIERCIDSENIVPTQSRAESQFFNSDVDYTIYPNPVRRGDLLNVEIDNIEHDTDVKLMVFDGLGRLLKSENITQLKHQVQTQELLSGTYTLMIQSGENWTIKKLIILD